MDFRVVIIPGDGIGPEIVKNSKRILGKLVNKYNLEIEFTEIEAGDSALSKYGEPIPSNYYTVLDSSDIILKGPVGETAFDVVVKLRQRYDLFANIRPAKSLPNVASKFGNVDILIVRENTEDLYKGIEFMLDDNTSIGLKVITKKASKRIAEVALNYALKRRKKVVCVHKANVNKLTDGLFARVCKEVLQGKVHFEEMYVDAAAANLVRNPQYFDVIVTTNVYGDILSDEAQIAGSLGLAPSANIGDNKALFEPVHGAAFDIAGKNIANPTAFLLSCVMMFEYMFEKSKKEKYILAASDLEKAIYTVYSQGEKITPDVGGKATLSEMVDAIYSLL
ncbi:MAG: isocitrate/isopropylmalate dehydrogenase family protein [Sulfolobaceae archaeon]